MAWIETHSASFTARHESGDTQSAREVLDELERFRAELDGRFRETPGEVAVVIHAQYAQLVIAQPAVPLAQLVAAPASRRYFGGWFGAGEVHVLAPRLLRQRASAVEGSLQALMLAPRHEYAHLVVGRNNADLPPPFTPRTLREYVRWAWLCEGAATYLAGQHRHLRPAIARRLREGPRPSLPPSARDAPLLGGAVFALLEEAAGAAACVELACAPLADARPEQLLERSFGRRIGALGREWLAHLDEVVAAERR